MTTLENNKKMSLGAKSILGVLLGLIAGLVILMLVPEGGFRDDVLVGGLFHFVGDGYLTLIKMTIVPFVFATLVMGISSASDVKQVGRIGSKSIGIYLCTSVFATIIGIVGGMVLKPGVGFDVGSMELESVAEATDVSVADTLLSMIPSNIIQSMAEGKMIHIVIFATFFGIAISLIGKKAEPMRNFIDSLGHVMLRIVDIVMEVTPYGVFCLMAKTVINLGYEVIFALAKYAVCEIGLFVFFAAVIYLPLLYFGAGVKPAAFLKKYSKIAIIPFSTSSSNATIPYSIGFLRSMGVSNKIAGFTIPLGCTINMDGSSIMQGMTAVFVAQLYNIDLTFPMLLTICITATLAVIGSPGMPGVVMVTLVVVLQSVGFPLEAIALIVGIDRFTDMFKTVLNVMGDSVCSIVIAKTEKELDYDVCYSDVDPMAMKALDD